MVNSCSFPRFFTVLIQLTSLDLSEDAKISNSKPLFEAFLREAESVPELFPDAIDEQDSEQDPVRDNAEVVVTEFICIFCSLRLLLSVSQWPCVSASPQPTRNVHQ